MAKNRFYLTATVVGNNVLFREWIDGKVKNRRMAWEPTVYLKCKRSESTHKSLYGDSVKAVKPGSIYETREFIKKYKDAENFEIFGQLNYTLQFLNEFPQGTPDFSLVPVRGIDIETRILDTGFAYPAKAEAEITLITCIDRGTKQPITFGCRRYTGNKTNYILCNNETDLLSKFLAWWESDYPVIVTGWNTDGFDLGYLANRIRIVLGENNMKRLSPWGIVSLEEAKHNSDLLDVTIEGIESLDYLSLMKKFTYGDRVSWSLGSVAEEELGTTKVDFSEYKNMNEFMDRDWDRFVLYNVIDVELVMQLDDKMQLIDLAMTLAYMAKINYSDVHSPVKTWDAIIHNRLFSEGVVVPQRKSTGASNSIMGGYVKSPKVGFLNWGTSIDATSLYPSIMRLLNLSPETYRGMISSSVDSILNGLKFEDAIENNLSVGANGATFDRSSQGVIPKIIEEFMANRKKAKNEMLSLESEYEKTKDKSLINRIAALNNLQMALKILQNSLYGAISNLGFRFFNNDVAESITSTGQLYLRTIENNIDRECAKVFKIDGLSIHRYSDTDSVFFELDDVIQKYAKDLPVDKKIKALEKLTTDKIVPIVNKICADVDSTLNVYEPNISFKLEKAFDKAVFVAKKKYVVRVHSSEGVTYSKPKVAVTGLEMIRSSTPTLVREKLASVIDLIFDKDEETLHSFVEEVREEFKTCDLNLIATPKGTASLDTSVDISRGIPKGTPIHVRAALLYNQEVEKKHLLKDYNLVKMGDKIKYVYLKLPNPIKQNIIGWPTDGELPKEFGLDNFIDRDLQFEKSFLQSTKIILDAIKWSPVKIDSLDDFFN